MLFRSGVYGFLFAEAVRVDPQDNIWIVDRGSNMVIKFDPAGRILMTFSRKPESVNLAGPFKPGGRPVAGDNFDARIIDQVVSPRLGKGTLFKSLDKILPIPQHYHASFARWHQLAMLKTPEHIRELERLQRASLSPDKIARLDRKSTRLNSSHEIPSRMPSSA